jgi:hypothetical protein
MDSKSFIIATLAGTVSSFIVGFLIYGMALQGYMEANTMEGIGKEPNMLWIVISHVILGAGITYIWMKWAGIKTLVSGLTGGLTIGLFFGLSLGCVFFGTLNFYSGMVPMVVDSVAGALIWAGAGAGAGWSLGKF